MTGDLLLRGLIIIIVSHYRYLRGHVKKEKLTYYRQPCFIFHQIEFYFGDANLSKDRFMKQEITKHPEGRKYSK